MKIALLGYGKMGKILDEVAHAQHLEVVARITQASPPLTKEALHQADVCIDFSAPEAALHHIAQCCEWNLPLVVGTTGWDNHLDSVRNLVQQSNTALIYSPNFSIGMAVFTELVRKGAHLLNQVEGYDAAGYELHHQLKGDSPSGTALHLTGVLCKELDQKDHPDYERQKQAILPNALHFASVRCGHLPGTHTVLFDSTADTIELTHRAHGREGFALGALAAARWIRGKNGVFTLEDMVERLLNEKGEKK